MKFSKEFHLCTIFVVTSLPLSVRNFFHNSSDRINFDEQVVTNLERTENRGMRGRVRWYALTGVHEASKLLAGPRSDFPESGETGPAIGGGYLGDIRYCNETRRPVHTGVRIDSESPAELTRVQEGKRGVGTGDPSKVYEGLSSSNRWYSSLAAYLHSHTLTHQPPGKHNVHRRDGTYSQCTRSVIHHFFFLFFFLIKMTPQSRGSLCQIRRHPRLPSNISVSRVM